MASSSGRLTPFQAEVLRAFVQRAEGFYLTGGAALAGFHLGHRETSDLDFFTLERERFEPGIHALADAARALGTLLEVRVEAPGFRRSVLTRAAEALVVDLVLERAIQLRPVKGEIDGIPIDPPEEILACKLTTLVGRCEERDLVDVFYLERSGLRVEDFLAAALAKDGGCTPATLAWLLSQVRIPDGATLPGDTEASELREYVTSLVSRLRRAAAPASGA